MATRRNVTTSLEKNEKDFPKPAAGEKSNIAPAVPAHVIYKLLGFTLAMIVCPIGSYFLTVDTIFRGNSTYAGATAAIIANVVLIGYVIVAFKEDESDAREAAAEKEKQERSSKKGI